MKSEIIDRIRKLLALATSDNEAEASLAAQKAQELLVKHNLSMSQVEAKPDDYVKEEIEEGKRRSKETLYINRILSRFYFVDIVSSAKPRMKGETRRDKVTIMLGKPHNIEIAKYVSLFLHRAFKDLWLDYRKRTNAPLTSKDRFWFGLYTGLTEQLKQNQIKVEQQVGLIVVPDAGLTKYVKQVFPRLGTESLTIRGRDSSAQQAGHEQGKNLKISMGIGGSSGQSGKAIGGKS